jgi:diaminopimelate decarboxylase
MDHFNFQQNELYAEQVSIREIAQAVGTPCYIYSVATLKRHWQAFSEAFKSRPHKICYAVKANSNLAVLNILAELGSGFDVVSKGELMRVIAAKGDPRKVVYSGVGKTASEIEYALEKNIFCFNVESKEELQNIQKIAQHLDMPASIALRINPDIDAKSHPYVVTGLKESKFGIPYQEALPLYQFAQTQSHLKIIGLDYHIGSQLVELSPFIAAINKMNDLIKTLLAYNIPLKFLDIGGGLGVVYEKETPPLPNEYAKAIIEHCPFEDLTFILEPGRAIAANAGILVTKIIYLKEGQEKNFCIVDAAMNDLLRPSLYQAWQNIIPIKTLSDPLVKPKVYDIVGPVCESGDFLGKDRLLRVKPNDYLAVRSAGAYGFVMSSNYNSRARACEVMVHHDQFQVVRKREPLEKLYHEESLWQNL